jgi:hypothetical protein
MAAASVGAEGERILHEAGLNGRALVLEPDLIGLTIE